MIRSPRRRWLAARLGGMGAAAPGRRLTLAARAAAISGALLAQRAAAQGRAGLPRTRLLSFGRAPGGVRPTKFQRAVNLRTVKALGVTLPDALLQRVDEVIR